MKLLILFVGVAAVDECTGDLKWNDCGSACPLTCGEEAPEVCPMVCVQGCGCEIGLWRVKDLDACVDSAAECPIGGKRDEHGCLGPAGYSWCELKHKCLRVWEEPCCDTVEDDYGNCVPADCSTWYDGCHTCQRTGNGGLSCSAETCRGAPDNPRCLDDRRPWTKYLLLGLGAVVIASVAYRCTRKKQPEAIPLKK